MHYQKNDQLSVDKDIISMFLNEYKIKVFDFTRADSGIENRTYFVNTQKKSYVLRIYRHLKKTIDEIENEINFMRLLKEKNIFTPKVYKDISSNNVVPKQIYGKTWHAILMEYIEGIHPKKYDDGLVEDLALTQATIHKAGIDFIRKNNKKSSYPRILSDDEFLKQIDVTKIKNHNLKGFIERGKNYFVLLDNDLPFGYCHLDLDIENVLVNRSGKICGVLDFDDAKPSALIACLGSTLWSVMTSTDDLSILQKFMEYYEQERHLTIREKKQLSDVILLRNYAIAGLTILKGQMDKSTTKEYIKNESIIKSLDFSVIIKSRK